MERSRTVCSSDCLLVVVCGFETVHFVYCFVARYGSSSGELLLASYVQMATSHVAIVTQWDCLPLDPGPIGPELHSVAQLEGCVA